MVWKRERERKHSMSSNCSSIQKSMGGGDLVDMLLSLCQKPGKTKRWYQKVFQQEKVLIDIAKVFIDMAKINTWILYCRHFRQNGKLHKDQKSLLQFSLELSDALNLANKINLSRSRGQPSRRRSLKAPTTGKKSTQALPVTDDYQQNSMQIMQNAIFQIQDLYLFTG